jgi:energy-coupling factor transporter ATP-binding protein EcfA2
VATAELVLDDAQFEERAENLTPEQFELWTNVTDFEEKLLRQLTNRSPRLLVGPRGCGKSTLMLLAAQRIRERATSVPIYVNYGKSMFLEPAFTLRPDATEFFQDWLVARILMAARDAPEFAGFTDLQDLGSRCDAFVEAAEMDPRVETLGLPGPSSLARLLEMWSAKSGRGGTILLLDDAAQAFVPEQQRIFFDFLQSLRTPGVSYKAAIYPGVTEYSPTYNIGHDAKTVDAWVASNPEYLAFMHDLLRKRLGDELPKGMSVELLDLFAVASFGIPRGFLSMVERFIFDNPDPGRTTNAALTVINEHAAQVDKVFHQLSKKVPAYSNYIAAGIEVESRICAELHELNQARTKTAVKEQAVEVAIRTPLDPKLNQVLALLEYAGIVRRSGETVSYGDHAYARIAVHSAVLLARRALAFGQNPTLHMRAQAAIKKSRQFSSKRVVDKKLLTPEWSESCVLQLGVCDSCGQTRPSVEARFCFNCGAELRDQSRYAELVKADVGDLQLTDRKISAIRDEGFATVEDVLNDRGQAGLRRAKGVGPVWSRRIQSLAVEYVSL